MPAVLCADCGQTFHVIESERWKRVCIYCYRGEKRAKDEAAALRRELEHLRRRQWQAAALEPARVRQLLQLCHPDKHGGSRLSVEATQWLLSQKRSAAA
jgi:hypothetical protein